jgi:DNA-binding GntR family transcriptional regulator
VTKTGVSPIAEETQSLVDRVSHAVRRSILEGRLRPGEALSISDLAKDLGVSHSPIREALQRLAGQGLVLLRPSRTAIVAPLKIDDLQEIYHLRYLNEIDAVVRASELLSAADLERLEHELTSLGEVAADSEQIWDSHQAFHHALMRPVLTPRLDRLITELWHANERYFRVVYMETDALDRVPAYERHIPLLEAARSGDPSQVRTAITEHLQANEQELTRSLQRMQP